MNGRVGHLADRAVLGIVEVSGVEMEGLHRRGHRHQEQAGKYHRAFPWQ